MKQILCVIDTQNDFIEGSLRNEEAIKKVPNIVKKIKENDWDVIYVTQDTHDDNYLETREGKNLPVVHCVKYTDGWKINEDIDKAIKDAKFNRNINVVYIHKPTFGSHTLKNIIEEDSKYWGEKYLNIEFCGFCTDICVISNVLLIKEALYEEANIIVDASCCAGITPEGHEAALAVMNRCQIDIYESDDFKHVWEISINE